MNVSQVRQEIHDYIDQADERLLRLVRGMLQAEQGEYLSGPEEKMKAEMIRRVESSEQDIKEGKVYTIEEAEARLSERLDL
ncbi:MAG: hypothetical protein AAF363_01845 [Bacteroidota bacterium]